MTWNPNHHDDLCVEFENSYLVLNFPDNAIGLEEVLNAGLEY